MKKYLFSPKFSFRPTILLPFVLLVTVGMMGISAVAAQDPTPTSIPNAGGNDPTLMSALNRSGAQITFHPNTGKVNFIGVAAGNPITQPITLAQGASGEEAARGFLSVYGSLFGINNQAAELVRENEKKPDNTRKFERFQQVYNGVPVIGGELIVQVDNNSNILSANGEVLPRISLSTTPTVTANT
ncbi:MAG: hypothetical protein H0X30_35445, partial [Anaerolineae bacterium]|nr:hypothetical protein [Anaerolineae bacterium]